MPAAILNTRMRVVAAWGDGVQRMMLESGAIKSGYSNPVLPFLQLNGSSKDLGMTVDG